MPQQLIYTSAPRGLAAGRAGFCTVAMSVGLREALALKLEQISYFDHGAMGAGEQVIRAFRLIDLRGTRYFVLSRVQDCGLDFTQRTNFIAHHLIFTPEEVSDVARPPEIFRQWNGWLTRWDGEPSVLSDNDWGNLYAIPSRQPPARAWARLAGDAMNAFALLETSGLLLNVEGVADDAVLDLFAESLALLEAREARDFRAAAWQFTFTTALQNQDAPAEFRWRCVRGDGGGLTNLGSARVQPLLQLRPARVSVGEASFARSGYQPPKILAEPKDAYASEGESVTLRVDVSGLPTPNRFQWFSLSRTGAEEPLADASSAELSIRPARGMNRYCVKISNLRGDTVMSRVAQVSVDAAVRVPGLQAPRTTSAPAGVHQTARAAKEWTADPLEAETFRLQVEERERKRSRNRMLLVTVAVFALVGIVVGFLVVKRPDLFLNRHRADASQLEGSDETNKTNERTPPVTSPAKPIRDIGANERVAESQDALKEKVFLALLTAKSDIPIRGALAAKLRRFFVGTTNGSPMSVASSDKPDRALLPKEKEQEIKADRKIDIKISTNSLHLTTNNTDVVLSATVLKSPVLLRFVDKSSPIGESFQLLVWPNNPAVPAELTFVNAHLQLMDGWPQILAATEGEHFFFNGNHPDMDTVKSNKIERSYAIEYKPAFETRRRDAAKMLTTYESWRDATEKMVRLRDKVGLGKTSADSLNGIWDEVQAVCIEAVGATRRDFNFSNPQNDNRKSDAQRIVQEWRSLRKPDLELAEAALSGLTIDALEQIVGNGQQSMRTLDGARQTLKERIDSAKAQQSFSAAKITCQIHYGKPDGQVLVQFKVK